MSDDVVDPGTESRQRRRAAIGLLGIALVAGIVVLISLLFVHGGFSPSANGVASGPHPLDRYTTQVANPSPGAGHGGHHHHTGGSSAPSGAAGSGSSSPSPSPSPKHHRPAVASCPTSSPCTLSSDGGDLIGAINAYRTSHGAPAVPGSVSRAAEQCAIGNGDSSACPQSYYWEPVSRWKGSDVLDKIVGNGGGASYLLDPSVKSFQVGWAYVPGSHEYLCAVVTEY